MTSSKTDPAVILFRYLRGLGITALCTAIAYPVFPYIDPVNIVMVYLLGATVAGLRLGRGPSVLTAVANTAAFDFFFVPPRFTFYVAETQYFFTMGVMLGVAFIIANLMESVRRQTQLAAAREREALRNTLLASISHDLRGPLSVIAGAGSLIAQSGDSLDQQRRKTLGHLIEEKARDMSALLTNVLELMRLETVTDLIRPDWQSLEELVGTAVRNNDHRLGQWFVTSDIPADFPLLFVDGHLTVQLLSNLLENATKHTPAGTSIALTASVRDGKALLTVEDDGPGFGSRDPERLFEKFERGHEESHVSGVGLGLAICRTVARLHGGEIRAANRPAGGARFEITLPLEPVPRPHEVEKSP